MTTGGINSGWFLPTFMEIVFLVSNVSYKPKLLQLFFFESILKLWGRAGLVPEKTFSVNSVCTWNCNAVCCKAPRKPPTNPSLQLSELLIFCHPPNSDFFFLVIPGLNDLVWRV